MAIASSLFDIVYGRNLVAESRYFCHRPYLVVTMRDIWHKFERHFGEHMAGVYFVETLEYDALERALDELPGCNRRLQA